ncbi:MAG TPA: hypothetical protein VMV49_03650 [Candidatus Deferrimicrobium sp.]|nr:hypothetical protein [Candidatus Deferrimicrobium sp.]
MELFKISDPKNTADPGLLELEKLIIEMIEDEEPIERIKEELLNHVKG